jgi:hypothetical protein
MAQLALCDVNGLLDDLMKRLIGRYSKAWLFALKAFLRHGTTTFETWREVTLGTIKSTEVLS